MPEFSTWMTRFDETAGICPSLKKLPLRERFVKESEVIASIFTSNSEACSEMLRLGSEYLWLLDGMPYYNVHHNLVSQLCRCKLHTLPASYFEVPGGFDAVLLRFSEPSLELSVTDTEYVRSIFMAYSPLNLGKADFDRLFSQGKRPSALRTTSGAITLRIDLGDRGHCDEMSYIREWVVNVRLLQDKTLEDEFAAFETSAPDEIAVGTRRREVLSNRLRLIATVGLIANSPEDGLLQYDVLAKDKTTFAKASQEARQKLIDRARRRGKHGWNVGTNEMFVPDVAKWSVQTRGAPNGEHSHAHIRTGHLHAVRCGPGRKDVKIKWFRPTVVRPDLPFATT